MNPPPALTGVLLGVLGVMFWHQAAAAEMKAALKSESDAKIEQMQRELTSARNEATAWQQRLATAGLDDSPVKENANWRPKPSNWNAPRLGSWTA